MFAWLGNVALYSGSLVLLGVLLLPLVCLLAISIVYAISDMSQFFQNRWRPF